MAPLGPAPLLLLLPLLLLSATDQAHAQPVKLTIPAAAEGHIAKLSCASGSISIESAQFGVNCPDCHTCKADKKGNSFVTTDAACAGKKSCDVVVCYEPHQPPSSATQPCVGTPTLNDPAFGCGKTFEVVYTCDSGWGWTFIIALVVLVAGYAGGGSAYNVKVKGAAPGGPEMLPHREFWEAAQGLVLDGARFAKARVDEMRGGDPQPTAEGYEKVGEAEGKEGEKVDLDSPLKADDKPVFGGSDGSDDDDDDGVVE